MDYLSTLFQYEEANKEILTDKFVRDQIANFLIAGRDTTAALVSWTLYYLSKNREVEEKLVEEVESIFGTTGVPDIKQNKLLKYMQCVLDETLRLRPPAVPVATKVVRREDTLPNGVIVKPGEHVAYMPPVVQILEQYWGEDAEQWKPDRWLDTSKVNRKAFVPFQLGERICLGMNMAYEEAKCILSLIFQRGYRFRLIESNKPESILPFAIIQLNGGMYMNVEKV